MSEFETFTCFPHLPKELRDTIWIHSLIRQLIQLRHKIYNFSPQCAPPFTFFLGGDQPYTHFTMDTPERPNSPYFTAHLEAFDVTTPTTLSVCRESRDLALAKGYKAWRMERGDGLSRDIMWDPSQDTVLFVDACSSYCFELFLEQFPVQVKEVEGLALTHTFWLEHEAIDTSSFTKTRLWPLLTNFLALKRLFIFVERQSWESWEFREQRGEALLSPNSLFPNNVGRDLYVAREEYQMKFPALCGPSYIEVPRVIIT